MREILTANKAGEEILFGVPNLLISYPFPGLHYPYYAATHTSYYCKDPTVPIIVRKAILPPLNIELKVLFDQAGRDIFQALSCAI